MMDYPGAGDYDVNTPFKYEEDEPPSDGVEDNRPHTQDDLLYTPLDFAHGDVPSTSTSNSHSNMMDTQPSIDLVTSSSNGTSHILGSNVTTDSVVMETNDAVPMETNAPSSPESDEIPLAARTRTRPSRSTRSKKSFAEVNEEEDEEVFETKPPKGININLYEITTPLVGTQSIFRSDVQKERRANLTKGSKKKKKKEPEFCRFCFTNELTLTKIRSAKLPPSSSHPNTKLTTLVPAVSEVELCLSEKWTNPSFQLVCDDCVLVFSQFYEFRQAVQTNDVLLRRLYCSSKAKSKKLPTTPTSAPVTPTPKGRGRPPKVREISSDDESDAKSTVSTKSNKKKARGKRKGVTDDEETDGYLSSVSKTSRKSTTSRKGGKKKKGGVTSDEETDGYMSSVSKKSTNTGSAAKSKKKRRYNSDSDNEDVKSDVSDGMDYAPTAYDASRSKSRRKSTSGYKSESDLEYGNEITHDSYNDDSDLDSSAKVGDRSRTNEDNYSEDEGESKVEASRGRSKRKEVPAKRSTSVTKSLGDLPKIVGRNIGLFTNSDKMASNYFDIVFKNRNTPVSNENVPPCSAKLSNAEFFNVKQEKMEWEDDKTYEPYLSNNDDDRYSPDMSDASNPDTEIPGGKRKRRRGRPKVDIAKKPRQSKKKKKEKKDEKRARLREELKVKMAEASDKPVEFDGDLENLKFEADEFFDGEVALYESSSDKEENEEDDDIEEEVWQCRHCPLKLRSHDLLLRHYTKEHGGYDWASVCYYCGYFNGHKKMIYLHIKDHYAPKKREMKICDICCAEVLHLQQHQKAAHSGVCYDCTFCGKGFTRKAELNIHIKAVHLKHQLEQRFVCQYCNKDFPFMKYLKRHLRVHSNDMQVPQPYKCTACNAAFNTKSALNVHRKTCPNLELLNRELLPNQTGTVTPEPQPQAPQQQQMPPPQQQQRGSTRPHRSQVQPEPPPVSTPPTLVPIIQEEQILLQSFIPTARDLRDIQIGLALPPTTANSREIQIANTARELQLASSARELQLTNLSARDLQNLQNAKFERPQMYYY